MTHSSEVLGELLASSRVDFLTERVNERWATMRVGDNVAALVLGRFELDRVLGRGTYGAVFAAYDRVLERDVALKVFCPEAEQNALHEAQVLARVRHPNVVTLHDIGHDHGFHYLVLELVDGWTMSERVRMGLDWQTIVELFVQVGRGLAALHWADIVHGDVKPSNMLVGRDAQAYLADFGFAQRLTPGEPTRSATPRGTPQYMAPECVVGSEIGPYSDQFSFCVALWEALYGERRQGSDSQPEATPSCGNVPAQLEHVIRRGVATMPQDRFPEMVELIEALVAVQQAAQEIPDRTEHHRPRPPLVLEGESSLRLRPARFPSQR